MRLQRVVDGFSAWIDMVADALVAAAGRLRRRRAVRLSEGESGVFSLDLPDAGSDIDPAPFRLDGDATLPDGLAERLRGREIDLILRPDQFLLRPLELPRRAAEFLDGIVRAQIDRLTPWTPQEAAFGWTAPVALAEDRIAVTVVATARARITPYLDALKKLGARSIAVSTSMGAEEAEPVRVHTFTLSGTTSVARVRRLLLGGLAVASATAVLAVLASQILGSALDTELADLNRRITERRLALVAGRSRGDTETSAVRMLERRKHETAATVLVLEALSRVLPDHTYVTEMHIDGDKLQVIGISREAPTLIRLMEQSAQFTRATFFAPTTRAAEDPGERFHIEARIRIPFEVMP
ncbi:PilN domain-containing protein [Rhodoplanes roseus]|uniref:Fimbrial assembly protein n=1 Tax=Rhodoplanes roseus TaxID=29409 RepID=A0A327KZS8_9BRAD|nr:PilN domain-containing protein [Rhodoplanes roseus]RAI43574.1 hypothetical protein CH341_13555 [Rhodoplanes roseus]